MQEIRVRNWKTKKSKKVRNQKSRKSKKDDNRKNQEIRKFGKYEKVGKQKMK